VARTKENAPTNHEEGEENGMAQVKEFVGKASALRRLAQAVFAFIRWTWVPGHVIRYIKAEGARQERQELIDVLTQTIAQLENRAGSHRGIVRHMRAVRGVIIRRHNQVENVRRDGEGDDVLVGEMTGEEYEEAAKKGGGLKLKGLSPK
jgi:hypothetical protein